MGFLSLVAVDGVEKDGADFFRYRLGIFSPGAQLDFDLLVGGVEDRLGSAADDVLELFVPVARTPLGFELPVAGLDDRLAGTAEYGRSTPRANVATNASSA